MVSQVHSWTGILPQDKSYLKSHSMFFSSSMFDLDDVETRLWTLAFRIYAGMSSWGILG